MESYFAEGLQNFPTDAVKRREFVLIRNSEIFMLSPFFWQTISFVRVIIMLDQTG